MNNSFTPEEAKEIIELILLSRITLNLLQKDMADILGISRQTLVKLENMTTEDNYQIDFLIFPFHIFINTAYDAIPSMRFCKTQKNGIKLIKYKFEQILENNKKRMETNSINYLH